ncbi:MAG: S1 RNA-binding domain-containing protein, partial [archaeon]
QVKRESLWDVIKSGEVYEAEVISNKHFGSLVKLDEETSGVIQNKFLNKANKKLNVGDKIDVKVISVIKDDRKIYLDLA